MSKAYFVPKTRGDTARERQRRKGRLRGETKLELGKRRKAKVGAQSAVSERSRFEHPDPVDE